MPSCSFYQDNSSAAAYKEQKLGLIFIHCHNKQRQNKLLTNGQISWICIYHFFQSYSTGDDDDMFRIKGGTKQIIDVLCSTFDHHNKVKLSSVVKSIKSSKHNIQVEVRDGGGEMKIYRSHYVVSTIPPQLLSNSGKGSKQLKILFPLI